MTKKKRAVVVSLEKSENGKIKIKLDDLAQSDTDPLRWKIDVPYTFKEYSLKTFEELDFSDVELSKFGYSIIARLYAFYQQDEI